VLQLFQEKDLRIVFMGSPQFAVPILQLLMLNGHDIAAVYTRPDKPAGRGREPAAPPIKTAALAMGLPVIQVGGFKSPETVQHLADFRPQAIIVAAFGLILPLPVLDIAQFGCINVHPSLLPKYRGPSPVVSTLLAGEEFAGVSVMQLDAGMDSGPILARSQIAILDSDDAVSLTSKLFEIGARMVLEVLAVVPGGKTRPEPQNGTLATITREITKEDGRISWQNSALDIWRQVRAYQPWPQAYCSWQGRQVKILQARPIKSGQAHETGRVVAMADNSILAVNTGDGLLEIKTLQIEGKRAMSAGEFLRGQRDFVGSRLE
jgi:methionyl-tRNA formyltransferase